ncbi:MAG TPA: 30S ribosomal protein S15 [Victivallales bacterium]|nr:30S ribosomal protein S15 [Victivallales bacterium]
MKEKKESVSKFARKEGDTGSPEAQIAILTERINHLTSHMQGHGKDFHSRRGLMALVSRRRKLLHYLARKNYKKYEEVSTALKIRHG